MSFAFVAYEDIALLKTHNKNALTTFEEIVHAYIYFQFVINTHLHVGSYVSSLVYDKLKKNVGAKTT